MRTLRITWMLALLLSWALLGCLDEDDDDATGDDDTADDDTGDDDTGSDDDTADDDTGDDDSGPVDADGDGYDETVDCDDSNPKVNPGADEICDNWIDDNCDGSVDPCGLSGTLTTADADVKLELPDAGEKVGALAWAEDDDADGALDLLIGLPDHVVDKDICGAVMVARGPLQAGTHSLAAPDALLTGVHDGDRTGAAVAGGGDLDGDGHDDLAISAPDRWPAGFGSTDGVVYVVHGPAPATLSLDAADVRFGGSGWDEAGAALALDGDLDSDGFADLVIGDPGDAWTCQSVSCAGSVYVMFGPLTPGDHSLNTPDVSYDGDELDERAGTSVAHAGDVDGDGHGDLLIGAPNGSSGAGTIYLLRGPKLAGGELALADAVIAGDDAGDRAGAVVRGGGDLDGNADPDLLFGAPQHDGTRGAAYLFTAVPATSDQVSAASALVWGETAGNGIATDLDFGGDTDGNTEREVLVRSDALDATWLFRGPLQAEVPLSEASAIFEDLGRGLAGARDVNGDGRDDVALGGVGGVYVFFGHGL